MKKILLCILLISISLGFSQTAAPSQPPRNAWDVVSLFAGSYTDLADTNFNPNWGQSGFGAFTTPTYGGDTVKEYANLNYQGTETIANVDASVINKLHIDIYSSTLTSIRLSVIKITGGTVEKPITLTLIPASWNSFDIDLTSATFAGLDLTQIRQFKYDEPKIGGVITNGQTLIVDNFYFWRTATTQPPTLGAFTVPAKLTTDAPFLLTAPTSNSAGAFSYTSSNTAVATIIGSTVTIVGAGTSTITANQAADGPYGSGSTSSLLEVTPSGAPTQPARNAWDVQSLFAGAYADIAGTNFNPNWGQSGFGSFTTPSFVGDPVKQYANLNYQGTETLADVNASAITNLHIDIYSPTLTSIRLSVIKVTAGTVEKPITLTLVPGTWNSFDIDLTSATFAGLDLTKIRQFKYDEPKIGAAITNGQTIAVDNIYFWRNATLLPPTVGPFTVAPQPVGAPDFTLTPPTSDNTSPFTYTSSNTNVATISGSTVTIVGAGSSTITALQVSDGTYGPSSTPATFVASYPAPGPSPVPPARDPATVVSMFTGNPPVYANPVGYDMIRATWTGGTASDLNFPNGSDSCIKLDNLGYFGYVTSTEPVRFSVVGMSKLHIDIYVNTPLTNLFVFLLSNGDQIYNTGPLVAGWNSLDINLSNYPGADLSSIYGFKFEQNVGPPIQIYLDNIYFYVAGSDPTITDFTVPAKVFGDAPFALTAPTSNSAGAFTYSSSNPLVATVVGNMVTVTGVGTCTITANQAANGIYDAGSITASLVVSAPALNTPAPTPPARNTWDVVSLYSDAYTTVPSAVWVGASTLTDELLAGNPTKKMSNFIVEFINTAPIDVSEMTTLHMDIYALDVTGFNIWLLNNGDRRVQISTPVNGWTSIDIPMSAYSSQGLNLVGLIQLKFEGLSGPGTTAYVDNVYYYRAATLPPATVGTFTVPAKNVGDADFALTPPSSNNISPFTYTSSNTNVATILGNMVHIVNGGISTITASQVSDGTFGPTSKTATFVVSFPSPGPSPTPPLRAPSDVISMFTGTPSVYADPVGYNMVRSDWTAATTLSTIPNGTNTCLKVDNLGYLGYVTSAEPVRFSIVGMTKLHVDVYLNSPMSNLFIFLLANGDFQYQTGALAAGWNSLDIDLSNFAGADLANIYGFKFEQNVGAPIQMYLDNIYFWRPVPIITQLSSVSCNSTLSSIYAGIFANTVSGVTGYRFEFTNTSTSDVQTIDRMVQYVNLTDLPTYNYGTTYSVRVMLRQGTTWLGYYGASCTVTSPSLSTTSGAAAIVSPVCGSTLPTIYASIYTTPQSRVTGYRYRITRSTTSGPEVQILDKTVHYFNLTNLPTYVYGTTYTVEVALKTTGLLYSAFGAPCTFTSPIPTILTCGTTVPATGSVFATATLSAVTSYVFEVTNTLTSTVQLITRTAKSFPVSLITGYSPATTYSIRMAVVSSGVQSPFGASCSINPIPSARFASSIAGTDFKAVGYPNPFETNFTLNVTTTSDENVQVAVYDMIGRQVDSKEVNAADANALEVGANYPSGVYNVVVSQGENVKSLRMIKR